MNTLEKFKNYISEQYKNSLDLNLVTNSTEPKAPLIWLQDTENKAWLLDDEIGLALQIVQYDNAEELNTAIQEAVRTATQLQPQYGSDDTTTDSYGIWQVSIIWLVESKLHEIWRKNISDIRKESGFSEEVGLDAILCGESENISDSCIQHGLPQLLLQTRSLLKLGWDKIPAWLSANTKVAEMLGKFSNRFSGDIETYKLVQELIQDVLPIGTVGVDTAIPAPNPVKLERIDIKNFRNIGNLHLPFPKDKDRFARAHVVFGPNGTGKTSIFEALCLAAGGASNTLAQYLDDEDVEARKRNYMSSILSPLGNKTTAPPLILMNGEEKNIFSQDGARAKADWEKLEGTFQAQEDSRLFLGEAGISPAQRILKNYSTLADEVIKLADSSASAAKDKKSNWLKEHGLNASINIRETRAKRLIEGALLKESLHLPQSMLDWLKNTTSFFSDISSEGQSLATRWQQWKDSQDECIEQMAKFISLGDATLVRQTLANWLATRNVQLNDTRNLVARAIPLIEPLRNKLQGVEQELDAWGEWLNRQTNLPNTNTSEELNNLSHEIS